MLSYQLAKMGFKVMAINTADCSRCGPVLNLLHIGENQNIVFLLVCEACVRPICDAIKKKLKADTVIDVLLRFSAQKLEVNLQFRSQA